MTLDEIKTKMASLGFRFQSHDRGHDGHIGLFYRRINVQRQCRSNPAEEQLVVEIYDRALYENLKMSDDHRFTLEVCITGEFTANLWTKLKVYSLSASTFFERHTEIQAALVRAWEALA